MTDWELKYINLLEITAAQLRDMEQELRQRAQDIEKEARDLKLTRAMLEPALHSEKLEEGSTVPTAASEPSNELHGKQPFIVHEGTREEKM